MVLVSAMHITAGVYVNDAEPGLIVDHLVKNDDAAHLDAVMGRATSDLSQTGCDLIAVWAWGEPGFKEVLRKHYGFRSTMSFPYRRIIDSGYLEALALDETVTDIDVYNPVSWRVTHIFPDYA